LEHTRTDTQGLPAELTQVRELVGYLYRTVKTILLYPPTNPLPGEFRQQLFNKISEFTGASGPLSLQVRGDQFLYGGETIHEDAGGDDNFIATLTRDGIQRLSFLPTLQQDELDRFLDIVKKVINERNEDDDLVTLLWEAAFEGINYDAISELDSVDYDAIEQQLLSNSQPDATGRVDYASIVLEEGANEPAAEAEPTTSVEAQSTAVKSIDITGILGDVTDISDDLSQVDQYLREATQFDPAKSTVGILFEILIGENEIPEFRETCNLADNLYDRFVEQGNFGAALRIYEGIVDLQQTERDHSPARAQRLEDSRLRTADRVRIEQISKALNAHPGCDITSCHALLSGLPHGILPHLVSALADLEHYPARKAVCDILAERGADRIDSIGNGVFDKRWYVVRNVAVILGNIGGRRACSYLEKILRHDDDRVRKEVAEALVRIDPQESSRLLRVMLNDEKQELRLMALKALSRRGDDTTGDYISDVVLDKNFQLLEPSEQKEWLSALTHIRGDNALPIIRRIVTRWTLFDRANHERLRAMAVVALGDGGGPETREFLEKLSKHRNARIRDAANRSLHRLRDSHTTV